MKAGTLRSPLAPQHEGAADHDPLAGPLVWIRVSFGGTSSGWSLTPIPKLNL